MRRQASLDTGLLQELLRRPRPLDGDLWEEQAARSALLHHETVLANDERAGLVGIDALEWSKH